MKKIFLIIVLAANFFFLVAQEKAAETDDAIQAESIEENNEESDIQKNKIDSDENLTITKIDFTGLRKTRNSYLQSRFKRFIGKPATEKTMHDLETALQLEGLFNEIHIETEKKGEGGLEINVAVKEKITFIPLPFGMYSSSGFTAGGIVMDTNAFGRKDMFMLGGFYSKNNKSGMAAFSKSPKPHGIPGISIFFIGGKKTPDFKNLDNNTIAKYSSVELSPSITISEKVSEHITISNSFKFKYSSSEELDDYKGTSPEGIKIGSTGLSLEYSKSDWNGYFMSTNSASVSAEFGLTDSSDSYLSFPMSFAFSISEQHPVIWDSLRMYQKISGFYGLNNHIASFVEQPAGSVTILPGDFSTERIVGGNFGFEFAVKKFSWGMISLYADYQLVYTKDFNISNDGDYKFEHGPNGGMKFYLAKIAFPAVAMGLAYNIPHRRFQFSAALGMSF